MCRNRGGRGGLVPPLQYWRPAHLSHPKITPVLFLVPAASSGLSSAQVVSATGTEGQGLTVRCHFSLSANKKFFCKGDCKKDNILIETSESKAQKGRYTIESLGTVQSTVLLVTIKPLTKSDTGLYKCGMGALFIDLQEVYLTVRAGESY
uniref:Immunoglobulin V-set domain-containing protein n=1 Tax=Amphilophus citrinellus TaxID=61819 RepID=A0A3Q0QSR8_AMPCI